MVDDALDELVNQFSDPLSFLRELIQNAIDAGSAEVEVGTTYEAEPQADGLAVISVADWGGGMSREIIETKLTRLFSSAKDGDMTKIGKFGIGFVSVFAIQPDAVCVDTARDGDAWRVLFDARREFKLLRLEDPVEGTTIRIYKSMPRAEVAGFGARVLETVRYWCRHAECDIRVDGVSITEPFAISAPCSVMHDDGYSRVVAAHPLDHSTFRGLYNGGLTLVESTQTRYPSLAYKAWSPHLEHTLTRDAVIEDAGHARVMDAVQHAIETRLCLRAFEVLAQELAAPTPSELRDYYYRCVGWHVSRHTLPKAAVQQPIVHTTSGQIMDVDALRDDHRGDVVYLARVRSPLSDAAEAAGLTVVRCPSEGPCFELVRRLAGEAEATCIELAQAYALPLEITQPEHHERSRALGAAALDLIRAFGGKVSDVVAAHFDYPGSSIGQRVAVTQRKLGELTPISELQTLGRGLLSRGRVLVVNADHPTLRALVRLASSQPWLAAYMLVKTFFLGDELDEALDGRLALLAAELQAEANG